MKEKTHVIYSVYLCKNELVLQFISLSVKFFIIYLIKMYLILNMVQLIDVRQITFNDKYRISNTYDKLFLFKYYKYLCLFTTLMSVPKKSKV